MLAAIARGGGLATTQALLARDIDPRQIRAWVRAGRLVAVRRGVYTTAELWESWDPYHQRPLARVRAVELSLQVPHIHSHDSAAIIHHLPLLRPHEAELHVTRRHLRASVTQAGVRHHGARYPDHRALFANDLPVLDLPRTVVDIAREHGYRAGLVAADGAMQRGVSRPELAAAAHEMNGWPYSLTVQAVVADADPGAESPLETLARELVVEAGLGPVETQFPIQIPGGVAWIDLRVGRHLIEADGFAKFVPTEEGGLADADARRVLWEERKRQGEVCAGGFGMTRLEWADHWGAARARAIARLLAENAVTVNRFGTELTPQQAEFAARMRGHRYRTSG